MLSVGPSFIKDACIPGKRAELGKAVPVAAGNFHLPRPPPHAGCSAVQSSHQLTRPQPFIKPLHIQTSQEEPSQEEHDQRASTTLRNAPVPAQQQQRRIRHRADSSPGPLPRCLDAAAAALMSGACCDKQQTAAPAH